MQTQQTLTMCCKIIYHHGDKSWTISAYPINKLIFMKSITAYLGFSSNHQTGNKLTTNDGETIHFRVQNFMKKRIPKNCLLPPEIME